MAKIVVVGSGIMGNGIAQVFAQGNHQVVLNDLNRELLEKAQKNIREQLEILVENRLFERESVEPTMARISLCEDLARCVQGADLVMEAIPEKLDLKEKLFQQLEKLCEPQTIFATNTSGISIHLLATKVGRKDRIVGTHFFMPAHLIPLVEVISAEETSQKTIDYVMSLLRNAGKKPVHVAKDIPGFIGNRLQHALAREAMSLVQKGVATPEEIDEVVKSSLAIRLIFTGPMEQRDFNGLDTHLSIASYLYQDLEDTHIPLNILSDKVSEGKLGLKTGEGFYDWKNKNKEAIHAQKNQDLIDLLRFLQGKK